MELLGLPAAGGLIRLLSPPSLLQDTRNPPLFPTKNVVSSKNPRLTASFRSRKHSSPCIRASSSSSSSSYSPVKQIFSSSNSANTGWVVSVEAPPVGACSKSEVVDYYVSTLAKVLGSEKEAQMCIYDASWQTNFSFCCDIDEETSLQLASLPGVLSVKPDHNFQPVNKDAISSSLLGDLLRSDDQSSKFSPPSPGNNTEFWLVRMEKPGVQIVTKAQAVDYYTHTLAKVLRNEKDAQVSIYHISWEKDFGFCCHIDEECARDLAGVPGVLSVHPDANRESKNKNYGGENPHIISDPSETNQIPNIKTKRLFVTGLSFYTSEKTLRAAFEGYGELVEVKVIMDKISKRSKGFAFLEYTTEEAAGAALKEMNGKIINGWMIVVDVAKTNPPRQGRGRSRFYNSSTSLS